MSIKNWTVTTERVKNKSEGLSEYSSYLVSSKHKNHKNTTIIPLFKIDYKNFLNKTILETIEFDARNKKGGRKVESYAQSFNFILPPPHKPTKEQWENITKDLLVTLCNELNIKEKTKFGNSCFMNIHDQANPHLNLLVPRIFAGERLADLDRKNVLAKLKLQFNQSVMKHCEIDHTHHKPLRSNTGPRRTAQRYAYDKAKEEVQNALKLTAEAQTAQEQAKAEQAKAKAEQAKAERDLITLVNEKNDALIRGKKTNIFLKLFGKFQNGLVDWIKAVINKEMSLDLLVHRQNVEETANAIIENKDIENDKARLVEMMFDNTLDELRDKHIEFVEPVILRRAKPKA